MAFAMKRTMKALPERAGCCLEVAALGSQAFPRVARLLVFVFLVAFSAFEVLRLSGNMGFSFFLGSAAH